MPLIKFIIMKLTTVKLFINSRIFDNLLGRVRCRLCSSRSSQSGLFSSFSSLVFLLLLLCDLCIGDALRGRFSARASAHSGNRRFHECLTAVDADHRSRTGFDFAVDKECRTRIFGSGEIRNNERC